MWDSVLCLLEGIWFLSLWHFALVVFQLKKVKPSETEPNRKAKGSRPSSLRLGSDEQVIIVFTSSLRSMFFA